ncbi:unnamed protein product [Schistocephalus solidus]|uniref:Intraflagellar transport protein 81 homolog n=4 Tax=Schistocephalus solidus TaxID=70667 RepID=A0A183SRF2_SCHSO|nr:unnamed protein product [Schistocephalus solidus]
MKKASKVDDQLAYLNFLLAQLNAVTGEGGELNQFLKTRTKQKDKPSEPTDPTDVQGVNTDTLKKEVERQVKEMKVHISEAEKRIQRLSEEKGKLVEELEKVNKEHLALQQSKQLASQIEAAKKKDPDLYDRVIASANRSATHYQGQMDRLRADLDDANQVAERMREQNLVLKLQMDNVMLDVEAMKKRLVGEGKTDPVAAVKDKAKSDIKPLEDSIMTDLQTLHNLRKMFVVDLRNRIKKFSSKQMGDFLAEHDEDEDGSEGTLQQREKIEFLNNTVRELTSSNKSLQRDNADLQCELPRLEKRLNATFDRVHELEDTLREFREKAVLEKQRYKTEIDRLKENMLGGTKRGVNIAKPIRVGAAK